MQKQFASDYAIVATFIESERRWREYVFGKDPAKLAGKLAECDRAAAALQRLAGLEPPAAPSTPKQPSLF